MNFKLHIFSRITYGFLSILLCCAGCALEKQSGANRGLQNLTARYNILFNANEILKEKEAAIAAAYIDDYDEILSVYPDTLHKSPDMDKDLNEVIQKANKIIQFKEQSNYLGDAYFLLGKAHYLNGNYFNAVEFFDYVYKSFQQPPLRQKALVWKAKSLLYLHDYQKADKVLDTALLGIAIKKTEPAYVYATLLQYAVLNSDYDLAEDMAVKAIELSKHKSERLRWSFILAQLQEVNKKPEAALGNYTKIAKSNAAFDMAFHAELNRIRIAYAGATNQNDRIKKLLTLVKDDKYKDFIDQLYYQIAEIYANLNEVNAAKENYLMAVKYSTINQNQKGLAYLKIADISFKFDADYMLAKKYYDSTLTNLSPTYPAYQSILKKSNNLQLIVGYLQEIAKQDTLQMLAKLPEEERLQKIDQIVNQAILQQHDLPENTSTSYPLQEDDLNTDSKNNSGSTFYFYNNQAVSQGLSDFKKRWGDRKQEDNWRRSKKAATEMRNASNTEPDILQDPLAGIEVEKTAAERRQELLQEIPLQPHQLAQSNNKILNAYLSVVDFYKDVADEPREAIHILELVLKRFPESLEKSAIYYNLYRLYLDEKPDQAEVYKNLLLQDYPQTTFAKILQDPSFSSIASNEDALRYYNQLYQLFKEKQYAEAVKKADKFNTLFSANNLSAQTAYLKAISDGHLQKLPPFELALKNIVAQYPADLLVTPLVNQHLAYIANHHDELAARPVVLTDSEDIPFEETVAATPKSNGQPSASTESLKQNVAKQVEKKETPPPAKQQEVAQAIPNPVQNPVEEPSAPINTEQAVEPSPEKPVKASIFSLQENTPYYFVVQVNDIRTNLASSRFGIGQFNRTNYQGYNFKHNLKEIGNISQLIYVGMFQDLNAAKAYATKIIPLLPEIMKVAKDKYNFFIITQENLDKLADSNTLDSYLEFYQNNY